MNQPALDLRLHHGHWGHTHPTGSRGPWETAPSGSRMLIDVSQAAGGAPLLPPTQLKSQAGLFTRESV